METDRSFKTIQQLINILIEKHNVSFENPLAAERILIDHSYYTLINGYQEALINNSGHEQLLNINLETLEALHVYESNISSIFLRAIVDIEQTLKFSIQYVVALHFGINQDDYLNPGNYNETQINKDTKYKVLDDFKKIVTGKYSDGNIIKNERVSSSLKYHRISGNVPPWILSNELMFGNVLRWFKILPLSLCTEVLNMAFPNIKMEKTKNKSEQDETIEFFSIAFELLRNYRNGFAHGTVISKIYTKTKLQFKHIKTLFDNPIPVVKSDFLDKEKHYGANDLLALSIIICSLSPEKHLYFFKLNLIGYLKSLDTTFPNVDNSVLQKIFRMPTNFSDRLTILLSNTGNG
ncbi:Abi family protein [Leuconostoc gasicomitatum]|uniref:Abi family protein n=1 Tax=Leuconostoc gasicomitatum TaxID=115778 RepID=UPI000744D42D|nr:Abi family protein [Leuconostoc gasicomitatum]CUR63421.1 Abortive infection bacteriophage resistance protein [Leuconostoc gasicomitatum KG16-1]